jgi:uncharacterized protein YecE (DUF72 family)
MELGPKLGPINWQFMPTKQFDAADFEGFLKLLPKEVAGWKLRHVVEVRHESFRSVAFVEMARAHGVAICLEGDSKYPEIADATSDFVYARVMGTVEGEALGYDAAALDRWAAWARAWDKGVAPKSPVPLGKAKASKKKRDVFLYVISGHKVMNPAAAMALMERLG